MRSNRPSHTAFKVTGMAVALGHMAETRDIIPRGAAEASERLLLGTGRIGPRFLVLYKSPWTHGLYRCSDRLQPGTLRGIAERKMFCEHEVRAASLRTFPRSPSISERHHSRT